jgi:hypothetical protein
MSLYTFPSDLPQRKAEHGNPKQSRMRDSFERLFVPMHRIHLTNVEAPTRASVGLGMRHVLWPGHCRVAMLRLARGLIERLDREAW